MAGLNLANLAGGNLPTKSFVQRQHEEEEKEERQRLKEEAAAGVEVLRRLTRPVGDSKSGEKLTRMPRAAVRDSQALAIMQQTKAGLGLGVTIGSGFVINRLGPNKWSAPSFLSVKNVSAGLTIAFEKLQSAVCVRDEAGLSKFTHGEVVLGADVMFNLSLDKAEAPPGAKSSSDIWEGAGAASLATFTLVDGAGLDLSLKGGVLSVDKAANHAAYGEDTTPEKLLHGEVAAPTEFVPFYELLAELEAEEA